MGGWASLQHPASSVTGYYTETPHLVVVHPERFQVVGLCARSDFNVVYLFHSFHSGLDLWLTDGCLSPHTN